VYCMILTTHEVVSDIWRQYTWAIWVRFQFVILVYN